MVGQPPVRRTVKVVSFVSAGLVEKSKLPFEILIPVWLSFCVRLLKRRLPAGTRSASRKLISAFGGVRLSLNLDMQVNACLFSDE